MNGGYVAPRVVVAVLGVASVVLIGPSRAVEYSVVRSEGGVVASGTVEAFPDHASQRTVSVLFVVPSGSSVASDPSTAFGRPWAAVSVNDMQTGASCRSVGNPSEFSAGSRRGNPARIVGTSVVVECGGRSYSVQWDHPGTWLNRHPAGLTHGEKVLSWATDAQSGTVTVWPDEQQPMLLTLCEGPVGGPRTCGARRGLGNVVLSSTGIVTAVVTK